MFAGAHKDQSRLFECSRGQESVSRGQKGANKGRESALVGEPKEAARVFNKTLTAVRKFL